MRRVSEGTRQRNPVTRAFRILEYFRHGGILPYVVRRYSSSPAHVTG